MDLSIAFYATACAAVLITGVSKSGFGGGLGVMAVPVMSVFVPPQFAAAVMMPILIAMDVIVVFRFRNNWRSDIVLRLLPGAALGLTVGGLLFENLDADLVRMAIGILALFFVIQYLLQRRSQLVDTVHRWPIVFGLGATSGFASYIAHAGGPPVKGYLLAQKMEKSDFVGTNTVFFFLLNSLKTVAYSSTGTLNWQSLYVSFTLVPVLFAGIWIGGWLHKKIDHHVFVAVVYVFLAVTAVRLLSSSIAALFW